MKARDIATILKNSLLAIVKGELLKRLKISSYPWHVVYTFFLMCAVIWISIAIDNTLIREEKNRKRISDLEIEYTLKLYEQSVAQRRTVVLSRLREMGSNVTEPTQKATAIE